MSRRVIKWISTIVLACGGFFLASAQDGAYGSFSPYSVYGIGDLTQQGTAYNKSMGGVGIADRSHRFINYLNPAAVSARDTLSFMLDFGLSMENKIYRQGDFSSANNTLNMYNFVFSFPVYKKTAMLFGITPFSDVGYDFTNTVDDLNLIGNTGGVTYSSTGNGGIYQLFGGIGTTFFKRLSVGAQMLYYFGNIDKNTYVTFNNSSYRGISQGYTFQLHALTGKIGLQYEQPLGGDLYVTGGVTYRKGTSLKGYVTDFKYGTMTSVSDTLSNRVDTLSAGRVRIADEIGIGVSLRKADKWLLEVDYLRSDWSKSGFDSALGFSSASTSAFSTSLSESFRVGFEFIPNRNDIRYYLRRVAYRGGMYYNKEYYKYSGNRIDAYGLTFGVTLPVFRWYNGVTVGVDVGRRGRLVGEMTRETYAKLVVGFNIHDIWFVKPRYE